MRHGMSRADVLALVACSAVVGCLGVSMTIAEPSGRGERLSESLANLRAIGSAMGQYRADNGGYTPLEGTTTRRRTGPNGQLTGLCGWQYGGKNNSAYWFNSGVFDVEAADRPLNAYLYPEFTFTAPTPPNRLPANAPERAQHQARVFRDPADVNGFNRRWPNPNDPAISEYDDVGTSYLFNFAWIDQFAGGLGQQTFRNATARLANDQGVDPARFVYLTDGVGDVVVNQSNRAYRIMGNHGVENAGVTLFADGHAGLVTYRPGRERATLVTPVYSMLFEDLGRPSGLGRKTVPERSR